MMTKMLIVLAFAAGMLTAHVVSPNHNEAAELDRMDDIAIDCEYRVTPKGTTLVKGGESC
jgi:hypothetical protein